MTLEVDFVEREAYLLAIVTGTFSLPAANRIALRILDECLVRKAAKVLVDSRQLEGVKSSVDDFQVGKFLSLAYESYVCKGLRHVRFAYLGTESFAYPKGGGEAAAASRDLEAKVTTDAEEAIRWLLEN